MGASDGAAPSRFYTAASAVCKIVRREIRTLSDAARDRYLDALNVFYRTPMAEGQRLYGPDFVNAAWITACHNSKLWCLHTPNPFLAAHAAFVYWGEESMRLIDPTVSLPYWDHMVRGQGDEHDTISPILFIHIPHQSSREGAGCPAPWASVVPHQA